MANWAILSACLFVAGVSLFCGIRTLRRREANEDIFAFGSKTDIAVAIIVLSVVTVVLILFALRG